MQANETGSDDLTENSEMAMAWHKVTLQTTISPRQNLTFQQLKIYYEGKGFEINDSFIDNLDLRLSTGEYNYAAYLLADNNGASIKVAKYAGTDKVNLVKNDEYGYRCLITATTRVMDRLEAENHTFAKITPIFRLEKNMVDKSALREAVINAIVHNDYAISVPVVEIFSDRIVVTSAGGLVEGLSQDDFFSCRSMPRNRELMRVFKDIEMTEYLGSGMGRILSAYNHSIFSFSPSFLVVTFPFEEGYESADGTNGTNTGTNVNENYNSEVGEAVLEAIKSNPTITLDKLSETTLLSRRTVARTLKAMQDSGVLRRIGTTRGRWEILVEQIGHRK
ncbi:MAG: winged helix-turn-helix transcriptional regulator [Clostridiales bacterium]|nr:winged helix-turn-helix transcriptional regulator [Clostridiales bacterium]